jgi:hypothetical protein
MFGVLTSFVEWVVEMQIVLIDGIKDVVLHNGMLRVDCVSAGPNGGENASGTLLIPGNIAGPILQNLATALTELEKKVREQAEAARSAEQIKSSGRVDDFAMNVETISGVH